MKGFFSKKVVESKTRMAGKPLSCISCGLYKNTKNPRMPPFGNFKKQILNIGEAPGQTEDLKGKQWQGKAGQLLQNTYEKYGIDLFEDCININAVNCCPEGNTSPTNFQIACCRKRVQNIIEEYQPKIIVLFGKAALFSLIGNRWKKDLGNISKWRSFVIPDKDYKAWVCPVFHPSYILRNNEREIKTVWNKEIQAISELVGKKLPRYRKPTIHLIGDNLQILNEIKTNIVSLDYETTGLKPHAKGHEIVCGSISPNENEAFVFTIPDNEEDRSPLLDILKNPSIAKTSHNIKFEHTWTKVIFGIEINNWGWDTMLASHLLDNRSGITGLKFQTYINFGIVDYSSEVDSFLVAKDSNSFNKVHELMSTKEGKEKLMVYCGYDTIYQYRLMQLQTEKINYDFLPF